MTSKTKRVLTEISKYKVYKLHETYLKEEFPCIYRKFLLRQVRQNTFSRSVENNVKSKGGEGLCRTYTIAFLVSGCREPIGNQFCWSPPCFWLQRLRRALPPDIVKLSGVYSWFATGFAISLSGCARQCQPIHAGWIRQCS